MYTPEILLEKKEELRNLNIDIHRLFKEKTSIPDKILEDIFSIRHLDYIFSNEEISKFKIGKIISSISEIKGLSSKPKGKDSFKYLDLIKKCDILPPIYQANDADERMHEILYSSNKPILVPYSSIQNPEYPLKSFFASLYKLSGRRIILVVLGDLYRKDFEYLLLSNYCDRYLINCTMISNDSIKLTFQKSSHKISSYSDISDNYQLAEINLLKSLKENTSIPDDLLQPNNHFLITPDKYEEYGIGKIISSFNEIEV